jgi:hypothetical protein
VFILVLIFLSRLYSNAKFPGYNPNHDIQEKRGTRGTKKRSGEWKVRGGAGGKDVEKEEKEEREGEWS